MGCPSVRCSWSCLGFLSSLLFFLSLLGLGASIVLVGWAYYIQIGIGDHLNLALAGLGYLWPGTVLLAAALVAPVHALAVGLRASLVKDFTCRRTLRKNPNNGKCLDRLLFLHVLLSCLSGFLVLGACAGGAFYWGYSRRKVRLGLYLAVRRYPLDAATKLRLDRLQIELHCCGSESFTDWFFVPWQGSLDRIDEADKDVGDGEEEYLEGRQSIRRRRLVEDDEAARSLDYVTTTSNQEQQQQQPELFVSADVPYSCCSPEIMGACVHQGIGNSYGPDASQLTISRVGCHDRLLERVNDTGRDVVACLLFISVYQLTLSILSRLLQTGRMSAIRASARAERFVGWIFGRGPRDDRDDCQPCEVQLLRSCPGSTSSSSSSSPVTKPCRHVQGKCPHLDDDVGRRYKDICREIDASPRTKMRRYYAERRCRPAGGCGCEEEGEEEVERCGGAGEEFRNLKSSDLYGRFRGTAQDALERRQKRTQHPAGSRRAVDKSCNPGLSSSSSSLPSPPAQPSGSRRAVATQFTSGGCPLHETRCCPVHDVAKRFSRESCPVHGDVNPSRR